MRDGASTRALMTAAGAPTEPASPQPFTPQGLVGAGVVAAVRSRAPARFDPEDLKRVKAWIPIDGTYDLGVGPRLSQSEQEINYAFSRCMTCGCCMEVCPQYNEKSDFIGPALITLGVGAENRQGPASH